MIFITIDVLFVLLINKIEVFVSNVKVIAYYFVTKVYTVLT